MHTLAGDRVGRNPARCFYPDTRRRRGPLRPSSLGSARGCGTFSVSVARRADPQQTVHAARVRIAGGRYAARRIAPAGATPVVA